MVIIDGVEIGQHLIDTVPAPFDYEMVAILSNNEVLVTKALNAQDQGLYVVTADGWVRYGSDS